MVARGFSALTGRAGHCCPGRRRCGHRRGGPPGRSFPRSLLIRKRRPSNRKRHAKPAVGAEKRANFTEPRPSPTWLQAQDMSGSSAESEQAVNLALAWLASHQFPTGGWSFDHRLGPCQGRCSNPGKALAKAVNGATAMALLPLIGHGTTHQTGPYRQNVAAGLKFLIAADAQRRFPVGAWRTICTRTPWAF